MDELLPIYGYARNQGQQLAMGDLGLPGEIEDSCGGGSIDALSAGLAAENEQALAAQEKLDLQGTMQETAGAAKENGTNGQSSLAASAAGEKVTRFSRQKLNDFDYLIQNFYRVDSTTTTNSKQLNAAEMLAKDMRIDKKQEGPQILIYHTHSQERFADSKDASESVVGLGDRLAELLEDTYGYQVLHHKGRYDLPDRDNAYSRAAPAVEKLLKENPGIQVIIDLHRDGVAENTRLVEKVNGKDTATIMFFNGLSHTTAQGDISYLYNPNLADNLAFSFQLQLAAAEYYPGFSRFVYLKGYRYNLHYLPKSLLVEVGAQTNTYQEVLNAMEPLADVLDKVLSGKN
ncbi:MAG: stage II sporulation protein P [Eubacterium sp.]|nr:stage II sporulation protein P [Eubacterium sp.]